MPDMERPCQPKLVINCAIVDHRLSRQRPASLRFSIRSKRSGVAMGDGGRRQVEHLITDAVLDDPRESPTAVSVVADAKLRWHWVP